MLDSSCGSMHWMPLVLKEAAAANNKSDFSFMGTDVVCSLINKHVVTFANQTNWKFQVRPRRLPAWQVTRSLMYQI